MENRTELKPVTHMSLVDRAEIRITEYIKNNKLKVGDSIPKEIEFAEALGVSRTVIREALSRLRTIGIIDSKKHKGMVLSQPDIIENFEKVLGTNLLSDDTLKDIFELRLVLEMGMVDLMFARKTEVDLIELGHIVDQLEKEYLETKGFSSQNEAAFHRKLYEMSGNETLQRFQNLLTPIFNYVNTHKLPDAKTKTDSQQYTSHRQLLNHLKAHDVEAFRKGLAQHLEPHFERVLNATEV